MSQSFYHAESSLHPHLSPDVAQTLILEDLHLQASEAHHLHADDPHHQIADGATEILIHTGLEACLDPGHHDATGRARGHFLHDLARPREDEEGDVTALDETEAEEGEAQVIVAAAVMMREVEAEVVAVEVEADVRSWLILTFQRWSWDEWENDQFLRYQWKLLFCAFS
jgi:hypothetical protein